MTDLASLSQNAQDSTPNPQAAAGLMSLMQAAKPRPQPTHAQTVAGLHRFHEIERAVAKVLKNPDLGKKNIRPAVLDMGADLVGEKVMTIPELMSGMQSFPPAEDPLGQKKWLERLYQAQVQAQVSLLRDHASAPPEENPEQWNHDNHADHMAALTSKYRA